MRFGDDMKEQINYNVSTGLFVKVKAFASSTKLGDHRFKIEFPCLKYLFSNSFKYNTRI
jgi:hypothetical protein